MSQDSPFPDVETALTSPNGLLAYGGDLSVERLLNAYYQGIFPWFGDDDPILWWSPNPRAIIPLENAHFSKSLRKLFKQNKFRVTLNHDFEGVIEACATVPRSLPGSNGQSDETWITEDMRDAYIQLHHAGFAHSIEVWENNALVGGLYGVAIGSVFCGESMFHLRSNTSKLAMYALVEHMKSNNLAFIDCQLPTQHLSSLGAISLPRSEFIKLLSANRSTFAHDGSVLASYRSCWQAQTLCP